MGSTGLQPKSKERLCRALKHGPNRPPKRLLTQNFRPLLESGWLSDLGNGSFELGPSCGLVLSIVARRESLECAVVRPDGRVVPRDNDPSREYELTDALFVPRKPVSKGPYPGLTPSEFVTKLTALLKRCLDNRRSISKIGFSAVCIAWPGRIDRFARPVEGRKPLGDVHAYEQKAQGGWTIDNVPVSLAGHVETALERTGFVKKRPPILVVNDADAELLALANIPREERLPTEEELKEGGPALRAEKIYERISSSRVALSVTVAGGVGGALLIDGVLARGQRGFIGELGEVPVDIQHKNLKKGRTTKLESFANIRKRVKFPRWDCPHEETLDYWASGRSILDQLLIAELAEMPQSKYGKKGTYTEELGVASEPSDLEISTAILKRAGRLIGLGIIGPVLMLDPGVILVSSPLPSEPIAAGIKELLNDEIGEVNPDPDIVLPVDGDSARLLKGTARWGIQEVIDPVLDEVCRAKNNSLKSLEALELTAWPPASRRGRG